MLAALATVAALAALPEPPAGYQWSTIGGIRLITPTSWPMTVGNGTHTFSAPSRTAKILIDVGAVHRKEGMPAEECLRKIVQNIRPAGFQPTPPLGGSPASLRRLADTFTTTGQRIVSYTWVGCNGRITWSLMFVFNGDREQYFAQVAQEMIATLAFNEAGPEDELDEPEPPPVTPPRGKKKRR